MNSPVEINRYGFKKSGHSPFLGRMLLIGDKTVDASKRVHTSNRRLGKIVIPS